MTRWLRYWARTVRPGVADPLGQLAFVIRWERGEIGGLPHCHILIFTISGAITAERKAVVGSPDLESLTTSHVERAFLTVRQELKRFGRKTLGYSKDLETHKLAVALQ